MNLLKKRMKDEKGLTLIELLAVIVILGVIAAIAVPSVSGIINNSKAKAQEATAQEIYNAAKLYVTTELGGAYPSTAITLDDLISKNYMNGGISDPKTSTLLDTTSTTISFTQVTDSTTSSTVELGTVDLVDSGATGSTGATFTFPTGVTPKTSS